MQDKNNTNRDLIARQLTPLLNDIKGKIAVLYKTSDKLLPAPLFTTDTFNYCIEGNDLILYDPSNFRDKYRIDITNLAYADDVRELTNSQRAGKKEIKGYFGTADESYVIVYACHRN
jgi:hypothetical protein